MSVIAAIVSVFWQSLLWSRFLPYRDSAYHGEARPAGQRSYLKEQTMAGLQLSAFAQPRGYTYSARPSEEAADLFAVLKANIVAVPGESGARNSEFSHLITGTWKGRDSRYFCHTHTKMSVTTGTVRSNSPGMGPSSIDGMEFSTTCCLQMHLRDTRGLPDLWVKKHTPLDFAYRLIGLRKAELQDPEMNRTFRAFCLDRHAIAPLLQSGLSAHLESLGPSEVLQFHDDYLLLTSRSAEGTAWIEKKLGLLSRLSDLVEHQGITPASIFFTLPPAGGERRGDGTRPRYS
jgi:hypothetical protein